MALCAYGISAALLIAREIFLPAIPQEAMLPRKLLLPALLTVIATAAFSRMRYVFSVPIGYDGEAITQTLIFSAQLVRDGLAEGPMLFRMSRQEITASTEKKTPTGRRPGSEKS
jgi:hypothetical protein